MAPPLESMRAITLANSPPGFTAAATAPLAGPRCPPAPRLPPAPAPPSPRAEFDPPPTPIDADGAVAAAPPLGTLSASCLSVSVAAPAAAAATAFPSRPRSCFLVAAGRFCGASIRLVWSSPRPPPASTASSARLGTEAGAEARCSRAWLWGCCVWIWIWFWL